MSYNTRRSNTGYGTPQNQGAPNIGQRRPVVTNNFVSGGQLPQQKPPGTPQQLQQRPQQPPQQQQQQQQQPGITFRAQGQQQQQGYQSTHQPSQGYSSQQQQQARYQQGQVKQEVKTPQQQAPPKPAVAPAVTPVAPVLPGSNPPPPEDASMDTSSEDGRKKFWFNKGKGKKISKAEKVRRRNLKLSKILQPKNAVMILNELVKGCTYTAEELQVKVDMNQFRGTVSFDGQEFAGTGRTKIGAKNAAAETALKHLVKNKQLTSIKRENGEEKMDIGEEDDTQVMPWSHIASFAMHKLFSTWGEDISLVNKIGPQEIGAIAGGPKQGVPQDPKPAKKMPENPEAMNPLMLMHQMLPNAIWEETGKSGVPPNVVFSFSVTVDNKQYSGTGSSKKIAKKMAAFAACHDVLKINYPPEVWAPLY